MRADTARQPVGGLQWGTGRLRCLHPATAPERAPDVLSALLRTEDLDTEVPGAAEPHIQLQGAHGAGQSHAGVPPVRQRISVLLRLPGGLPVRLSPLRVWLRAPLPRRREHACTHSQLDAFVVPLTPEGIAERRKAHGLCCLLRTCGEIKALDALEEAIATRDLWFQAHGISSKTVELLEGQRDDAVTSLVATSRRADQLAAELQTILGQLEERNAEIAQLVLLGIDRDPDFSRKLREARERARLEGM